LATLCNKNEQKDVKNNAELWTKWKTTWMTCEESSRQAKTSLLRPNLDYDDELHHHHHCK